MPSFKHEAVDPVTRYRWPGILALALGAVLAGWALSGCLGRGPAAAPSVAGNGPEELETARNGMSPSAQGSDAPNEHIQSPAGDATAVAESRSLLFVDADNHAVPGLRISVTQRGPGQPRSAANPATEHETGETGAATIDLSPGAIVEVELLNPGWLFAGADPDSNRAKHREVHTSRWPKAMVVRPINTLRIYLSYADGVPYSGRFTVHDTLGNSREVETGEDGRLELLPPETWRTVSFRVPSRRLSFGELTATVAVQSVPQDVALVIDSVDGPSTGAILEVDAAAFGPDTRVSIVASLTSAPAGRGHSFTAADLRSGSLFSSAVVPPGVYAVRVFESDQKGGQYYPSDTARTWRAWQGSATLPEGGITRVVAMPEQTSGIKVEVVFADGTPCFPCVLSDATASGFSWGSSADEAQPGSYLAAPSLYAFANQRGVIVAYGLLPTTRQIVLDAPGCRRQVLDIHPVPGRVLDLGRVHMQKAPGRITVVIKREGDIDDAEYFVIVAVPRGASVLERVFTGSRLEVADLEFGEYNVHVSAVAEDVVTNSQNVTLSDAAPAGEVVFTMRPAPK